jgi:hypothetical protein
MPTSGSTVPPLSQSGLTDEQRARIARNKANAMAKREEMTRDKSKQAIIAADQLTVPTMLGNIFVYRVYDSTEQVPR